MGNICMCDLTFLSVRHVNVVHTIVFLLKVEQIQKWKGFRNFNIMYAYRISFQLYNQLTNAMEMMLITIVIKVIYIYRST